MCVDTDVLYTKATVVNSVFVYGIVVFEEEGIRDDALWNDNNV